MRDDYQLEEVTGAVSLGLLASDVAVATSQMLRGIDTSSIDRVSLERGAALLRALSRPFEEPAPPDGLGQLGSRGSELDALRALEVHMPGEDVREAVRPLADALDQILGGAPVADHRKEIEKIQRLFSLLGEMEVSRVTSLSRPSPDIPSWLISPASSGS